MTVVVDADIGNTDNVRQQRVSPPPPALCLSFTVALEQGFPGGVAVKVRFTWKLAVLGGLNHAVTVRASRLLVSEPVQSCISILWHVLVLMVLVTSRNSQAFGV